MKKSIIQIIALPLYLIFMTLSAFSDEKPEGIDYLELSAGLTSISGDKAPLLMWINQNGRIPVDSGTEYLRLRVGKEKDDLEDLDWIYGIDVTAQTEGNDHIMFTDGYAGIASEKIKIWVGKKSELIGLVDQELSSGSEIYSRNAPTIPKVVISTNGYVQVSDKIAINAYLGHGWLGNKRYVKDAYLHQKYLYLRYGDTAPDKGWSFYTGIHHVVVWGGTNRVTGIKNPSGLDDFARVFLGLNGDDSSLASERENALGDHRGSIEFAVQLKNTDNDWFFYAQTMFEDSSGLLFIIPGDILLGTSYISKKSNNIFQRFNIEYLDTRFSGFSPHDKSDPEYEEDNYFKNSIYKSGWSYKGFAIGTPFIRFVPGTDYIYTVQNRIRSMNASAAMHFSNLVNPVFRFAYIENYGSFSAPLENPESLYAADLVNVSHLSNDWVITQQVSWDTENDFGVGFGVTKKVF